MLAIVASIVFFNNPIRPLFVALLAIPFLGFLVNGIFRPTAEVLLEESEDSKGDKSSYAVLFLTAPSAALFFRCTSSFHLEYYSDIILPVLICFAIMAGMVFITHKKISQGVDKLYLYTILFATLALYSYSGVIGINGYYSKTEEQILYLVQVTEEGDNDNELIVAPWREGESEPRSVFVSKYMHNRFSVGDTILVISNKGFFGADWYTTTWIEDAE